MSENNDITMEDNDNLSMISSNTELSSPNRSFESKPTPKKRRKLSQEEIINRDRIKAEKEKLRKEREQLRLEKEMEKLEREKARIEKDKMRIAREKQLREEREKKQNEQQLRQQLREKLRKDKELEKLKRLEEKQNLIDEENRKKEELKKLEDERLEKSRAIMTNFLKKSNDSQTINNNDLNRSINNNETIDCDDKLIEYVPENLLNCFDRNNFDNVIKEQSMSIDNLYLSCLLSGKHCPFIINNNNDNNNDNDDDINLLNTNNNNGNNEYIYLKFFENVKPPYYGPKQIIINNDETETINGRCPFNKLSSLDYDIDSDDEWDEGGPGESLSNTDSEQEDKEEHDYYEIDNEFFVPHGYLSDDESNINQSATNDSNQCKNNFTSITKEQTFLNERSRLLPDKLTPLIIGCYWTTNKSSPTKQSINNSVDNKLKLLEQFKIKTIPTI